jgi:hypothetical protein
LRGRKDWKFERRLRETGKRLRGIKTEERLREVEEIRKWN